VAFDALTVVINPANAWVDHLTVDELKKMWEPAAQGKQIKWSDVRSGWPATPIKLYGPGADSGTFDYFTEEINGEEGVSRADYEASEDDNVLVEGVANTEGAMGYFGYTYYEENKDKLKALEVDDGNGCVAPSPQTAQSGEYSPLARPLFIYVNNESFEQKPQVAGYVDFYIENVERITEAAQYIQLDEQQMSETQDTLSQLSS
jgi:phosphate transport system substrate-binding protein